ncbi:glycosyltransferase family 4 protein [Microbulbifer thermotolerans]|uniref:glycosyltransferase family 4 protein n=1 Tax=Microbulbifer thermotolerans TaxID=252514 RepID=UPI0020C896D7|nr:glycosyltransferase family 4 protein [Microbulbifer thermotolerans]WKT62297.1 glycosyltransferase family 4 protein [Microbulbifer thermotolerans]
MQLLPALNSGGVERGTVDFARALVEAGHESIVISNGGRMVEQLEREGSRHIAMPIHKKSLSSLWQVRPLRELLTELQADILHVRSRIPAWLTYLAWKKMPQASRPRLVSTAHGLYSINRYSAIMARSEQVIAISSCVLDYLQENYGKYLQRTPALVYRGVDTNEFFPTLQLPDNWLENICGEFPELRGKRWLLLPGRLTRWKGQEDFIELMARLAEKHADIHGVILGGSEPNKTHYEEELKERVRSLAIEDRVTFVGHRGDIRYWYKQSALVFNLSQRPEPFGRTVIEAAAVGTPIIGYDIGGPAESLRACFPRGLVQKSDPHALYRKACELLDTPAERAHLAPEFTLQAQAQHTIEIYQSLLEERELHRD